MRQRLLTLLIATSPLLVSQQWHTKEGPTHALDRQHWFYDQRTYPNGSIPAGARRNAWLQIQRNSATIRTQHQNARAVSIQQAFTVTTDSANWTMIGPRPTDAGVSPTSGRINAIALDPRDASVLYIAAAEGGVWKSTDAGATWKPLTDNQASLATGAIAIDPANPDTVYVGTGEENFAQDSYYGAGILKSTDGGTTWTNIVGPFLRAYISALAIHPTQPQVLLAATQAARDGNSSASGVWRSTDGGNTWNSTLTGAPAISVLFDPTDGNNAWATLGNVNGSTRNGVYHSTDGGLSWIPATGSGALRLPTSNTGRIELAMAPSDPAMLYAQIQDASAANFGTLLGIYKTIDSGTTWTRLSVPVSLWGTQMWFDNTIRVSPKDPNVIWSGGLGVYRSLNGGLSWSSPLQTGGNGVSIHVDFHALAFTPDGSKVYLGNDGGIYSTSDVSTPSVNWTDLNNGLAITKFYGGMALNPADPTFVMAGTQDNGTQQLGSDGKWSTVACGDGGFAALDQTFPALAYSACQRLIIERNSPGLPSDLWFSSSYGIDQSDTSQFIAPFVMDPSDSRALYFGTFRLWRTTDGAQQWSAASADLTGGKRGNLTAIAVAASDSRTVYIGTSNSRVQVTNDVQNGENAVWIDRSAGLPIRTVTRIAVDPIDPAVAYVSFSGFAAANTQPGYIFKTTDSGALWKDITGNLPALPVNDIMIDPDVPDTMYLATDVGVQVTTDGGANWSALGNGLPNVVVHGLALHRKSRVLRAATHGRSVWEIAIPLARPSLQPGIDAISPASANTGAPALTLSVTGTNFLPTTTVRWNGQARTTRFIDSTHLSADIPASDLAAAGRASVTVFTASSGVGASGTKGFVIGGAKANFSGFVSAANPTGGNELAQRSIGSLYGTDLASSVAVAGTPPLPLGLGGTSMVIGGNPVPFFFASPAQINFQVPFLSVTKPTNVPLTLVQGAQITTFSVVVKPFGPALFTTNAQGTGQASTVIAGTATLASPDRPGKAGEYLSIYCTGLGDVSNRPGLGSPSPSSPLSMTLTTPNITIGGINAVVSFSGLAPGFVGLYQVNVQVPDGVTPGPAVPLTLSIGGETSNTATIAVQ